MRARDYLILYLAAELLLIVVSLFQSAPGYMDADYYMAGGQRFLRGQGQSEPYLWNYLGGSDQLPVDSFQYWMPLTSIFAYGGMILLGSNSFASARLLLVLLAGTIAPLTAALAFRFSTNRSQAWFAGLLAIFSGFYLTFLSTTDAFAIYMVVGGLLIVGVDYLSTKNYLWLSISAGICVGLLHMARADGLIWCGLIIVTYVGWGIIHKLPPAKIVLAGVNILFAYILISGAWYWRNLISFGSLFTPGGLKTLWLTSYDDLFRFDTSLLSFQHWLGSGWESIVQVRISALFQNLQTWLAVQGTVFLLPLTLLGGWKLRNRLSVLVGFGYWVVILFVFSFVLPFPGVRGSFFHSGSSIQILFWALVPVGLHSLVQLGVSQRNWNGRQAEVVFQAGAVGLALLLTLFLGVNKLYQSGSLIWGNTFYQYREVGDYFQSDGWEGKSPVMVNNPPGYYLATGEQAIVIPAEGIDAVLAAARKFNARYLLLEPDKNFPELYLGEVVIPELSLVAQVDGIQIYQIETLFE